MANHKHFPKALTEQQVKQIMKEYKPRTENGSAASFARKYGVSVTSIHNILKGRTWRHVTGLKDPADTSKVSSKSKKPTKDPMTKAAGVETTTSPVQAQGVDTIGQAIQTA